MDWMLVRRVEEGGAEGQQQTLRQTGEAGPVSIPSRSHSGCGEDGVTGKQKRTVGRILSENGSAACLHPPGMTSPWRQGMSPQQCLALLLTQAEATDGTTNEPLGRKK